MTHPSFYSPNTQIHYQLKLPLTQLTHEEQIINTLITTLSYTKQNQSTKIATN